MSKTIIVENTYSSVVHCEHTRNYLSTMLPLNDLRLDSLLQSGAYHSRRSGCSLKRYDRRGSVTGAVVGEHSSR